MSLPAPLPETYAKAKRRIHRRIEEAIALLLALLVLTYAGDYAWLRVRAAFPRLGQAFSSIRMERLYAIPLNGGKTEYEFDAQQPEVTVSCVHSLFSHLGARPCWYLQRQSQKPIPMMILPVSR